MLNDVHKWWMVILSNGHIKNLVKNWGNDTIISKKDLYNNYIKYSTEKRFRTLMFWRHFHSIINYK